MSSREPVDWLFLTAVATEFNIVAGRVSGRTLNRRGLAVRFGRFASQSAAAVRIGIGSRQASRNARLALELFDPRRALLLGFSGGLDPVLRTGDLVEGERALCGSGDVDPASRREKEYVSTAIPLHPLNLPFAARGALISTGRLIGTPEEKRRLFEVARASAVDMESYSVAQACRERSAPLAVVRAISDDSSETLDDAFLKLTLPDGRLSPTRIASLLLRRPTAIGPLARLGRSAKTASESLNRVLTHLSAS